MQLQTTHEDVHLKRTRFKESCAAESRWLCASHIAMDTQKRFVFFMIRRNSSSFTSPSPSRSASSIISCNSSSVILSPSSFATRFKFLNEILPVSSSSNKRKAFKISSLGSLLRILCVIILRNSSYSMDPLPSSSTSEIIFWISSFLGSKPSARIATFSSLESIDPEPSVSNKSKASLISCFCSSVSSFCFLPPALKRRRSSLKSRNRRSRKPSICSTQMVQE